MSWVCWKGLCDQASMIAGLVWGVGALFCVGKADGADASIGKRSGISPSLNPFSPRVSALSKSQDLLEHRTLSIDKVASTVLT